ncbi:UDP-N-acetylmuramate dehydrogenase [bacterium]|nr:UDP-N-acetylmuramate dehydrogenase [bacterium]
MDVRIKQFQRLKKDFRGDILTDESMRNHTTFKIGGTADFFLYPKDLEDLKAAISFSQREGLPHFVIGNGSNLLVADDGVRGIVINMSRAFNHLVFKNNTVLAGAGGPLGRLIKYCRERGLSGLEWACGIPARLGGAVFLNAGAYGHTMADIITACHILNNSGVVERKTIDELEMGYRQINLAPDCIILECEMSFADGNPREMERIEHKYQKSRRSKQPLSLPNAGSIFRNPANAPAGKLIEECGCKGLRIGDAMVSKKHANFIINCGVASASDVRRLIDDIQCAVESRYGICLHPEIHYVGFSQ